MALLTRHEVLRLHELAVSAGLADRRSALVSGIDKHVVASIDAGSSPIEQVLLDISAMNDIESGPAGSVPLAEWIRNAIALLPDHPLLPVLHSALSLCWIDRVEDARKISLSILRRSPQAQGDPSAFSDYVRGIEPTAQHLVPEASPATPSSEAHRAIAPDDQQPTETYASAVMRAAHGLPSEAYLLQAEKNSRHIVFHELTTRALRIGRGTPPKNGIAVQGNGVSEYHARLLSDGQIWVAEDLGSKNGTYLNNQLLKRMSPLTHHDQLRIGPYIFRFLSGPMISSKSTTLMAEMAEFDRLDPLTELANRPQAVQVIESGFRSKGDTRKHVALAFNIDGFRVLCARHGEAAGDLVLCDTGRRLRAQFPSARILARLNGDVFIAWLPVAEVDSARIMAARFVREFSLDTFEVDEHALRLTCRGAVVASNCTGFEELNSLLMKGLEKAKQSGGNCVA